MQKGADGVCVTKINDELTTVQGFLVEFIATGILIWVICGIWDPRNSKKTDSTPLRAGLTVATLVMVAVSIFKFSPFLQCYDSLTLSRAHSLEAV